jgi:hypothetical protein
MRLHDKESTHEIEGIAPRLVKLDRNGGFRTPEAYFDDLQQSIEHQTLPAVFNAQRISADAKSSYFDALESNILAHIAAEGNAERRTMHRLQRTRIVRFAAFASGIAATIALLWFVDTTQNTACQSFECLLENAALSEADLQALEVETWETALTNEQTSLFTHLDDDVIANYILEDDDNEWMLSELMND